MKHRKLYLILLLFSVFVSSCLEDEIDVWSGKNYIHFAGEYQNSYSFAYAGSSVERDTIKLRINIAGHVVDYDREFLVKQVKSYKFIYEHDDLGNIIDSAFVEVENQAIPDIHYIALDNAEYPKLTIPANSIGAEFDVVLLRDESLKIDDYILTLRVQENENFLPGNVSQQTVELKIADQIIAPTYALWNSYKIGKSTVFSRLAHYGPVKHQLLIDCTGKPWDDAFIRDELTEEYLGLYHKIAVRELERINEERAAEGKHELREDDSNPNSAVYFF